MTEHNEIEYICKCGAGCTGLSSFKAHVELYHDFENVSEAVRQCDEIREIDTEQTIRLETENGHPKLVVGDTEILLRTFVTVYDETAALGNRELTTRAETDCDGDNGCWWNVLNDGEPDPHPWVEIQPELLTE